MAKGKIFIGEIMADMVAALGSIDDTMLSQIAKTDEQIIELQTINDNIGQSISAGNIKSGTENIILLSETDKTITNQQTAIEIGRIKSFAYGKINISAEILGASAYTYLQYSINGGTKVSIGAAASASYTVRSADINVAFNDEVIVYLSTVGVASSGSYKGGSGTVKYDLLNLVSDGFVVKV